MTIRKLAVPPALVGIIGVTGFLGFKAWGRRGRRPTGDELMKMSDREFESWIRRTGIKTVTSAGLERVEAAAD